MGVAIKLFFEPAQHGEVSCYGEYFQLCPAATDDWPDSSTATDDFWLQFSERRLRLARGADRKGVCIDPVDLRRRAVRGSELARACGIGSGSSSTTALNVLDGTGGWGVDGLTLALLGAQVTLLERSRPVWALAHNLCANLPAAQVTLQCAELWQWLSESDAAQFDVIYLDPMFPLRSKSAAPGKRLQYLAALVAEHEAPVLEDWLQAARAHARARIVLKRRRTDAPLSVAPAWQIKGRSIRYDVYDPGRL